MINDCYFRRFFFIFGQYSFFGVIVQKWSLFRGEVGGFQKYFIDVERTFQGKYFCFTGFDYFLLVQKYVQGFG